MLLLLLSCRYSYRSLRLSASTSGLKTASTDCNPGGRKQACSQRADSQQSCSRIRAVDTLIPRHEPCVDGFAYLVPAADQASTQYRAVNRFPARQLQRRQRRRCAGKAGSRLLFHVHDFSLQLWEVVGGARSHGEVHRAESGHRSLQTARFSLCSSFRKFFRHRSRTLICT